MKLIYYAKTWDAIPWWAGIAYKDQHRQELLISPLGVNWLVGLAALLALCLKYPPFFLAIARNDDLRRLFAIDRKLYNLEFEVRSLRTQNRTLYERNAALEKALATTIHDNLDQPNVRKV
jgi:hypothetical protein